MNAVLQQRMTRFEAMTAVAALGSLAATLGTTRSVLAQAVSPGSTDPVWETLGIAQDLWLAPGMTLELARFTFMPGYEQEIHTHTGVDVIGVLSGEVAWRVEHGEATVFRAPVAGAGGGPGDGARWGGGDRWGRAMPSSSRMGRRRSGMRAGRWGARRW